MVVGQTVYLEPIGNKGRFSSKIIEASVTKVGTKYFEVDRFGSHRFFIKTMQHDGGQYTSSYNCYLSEQEILDKVRAQTIYEEIKKVFTNFKNTLPLDKLIAIDLILKDK